VSSRLPQRDPVGRQGRRIGDRRVRIERVKPQDYDVRPPKRIRKPPSPALVLVAGFLVLIAIGTALLMLPFASADGTVTSAVVAFFTATSAVCVTGLVIVDTANHWSPFGQAVILALIQIGGFGFMTGSTLVLFLLVGRRTRLRDRVLVQASTGEAELGSVTSVVRRIAVFTLVVEAAGMILLTAAFLARGEQPLHAAISGVFHSISAFNNAGIDLMGDFRSLTGHAEDPAVLLTIAGLIVLGALGFAIVGDIAAKRSWQRLALETKVVITTFAGLFIGGSLLLGAFEWNNPATLGALEPTDRVVNAVFMSAAARTAGFNTIPISEMLDVSLLIMIPLMFIGGASGSTAGGIKVNTFTVLLIAILSTARGDPSATAFGRRIPHVVIYRAMAVALLSVAVVFGVTLGLELTGEGNLIDRAFEAVSALATVGLSTGLTATLPPPAQLLLAVAMFAGRLGPLTLVLALTARARPSTHRPAVETLRIG
jgi:trk system potassium uptake protein TrkH